ncbi:MAG: hypothetical protein UT34_C0002G0022 [candidate division WS6 bacterium GW2011_GWF2_39_15]|uniref:Uncharacterized protein n=1 Tax=candidate division WS6 bacterium GW2011_GWF2_39_15 TaxID=1619100 RepID=A0A0G0Q522_9BACT|nr:MAG: hypothetical protein UT34_C0002G0022 [candidate division WS6 bacterium GW2011_GWF2_39_15]
MEFLEDERVTTVIVYGLNGAETQDKGIKVRMNENSGQHYELTMFSDNEGFVADYSNY